MSNLLRRGKPNAWAIRGTILLRVLLIVLKYVFRRDLEARFPGILGLLPEFSTRKSGMEYLETVLRYLAQASDQLSKEGLKRAVGMALPGTGGTIMPTLAEK